MVPMRPQAVSIHGNGQGIEIPVVNVNHSDSDGRITEFWGATTDPEAGLDFWA
jgi:hypothetical protein